MARASTAELLQALWSRVISPLVTGGALSPVRPIGPLRAAAIAQSSAVFHAADSAWIDVQRVRHVRSLCPVDALEPPSAAQWALAAALNDLLQCTNPSLDGLFSRRSSTLIGKVEQMLGAVPPPDTLREALGRHATFALVLSMERHDKRLTWWCGSQDFRGCEPPERMLLWKKLRRVGVQTARVTLDGMAGDTRLDEGHYHAVLGRFLSLSPLTDLAAAARSEPVFCWTGPTLALVACGPGRTLALRALRLHDPARSLQALQRAPVPRSPALQPAVQSVLRELATYAGAS